jgi:hypothetical protein
MSTVTKLRRASHASCGGNCLTRNREDGEQRAECGEQRAERVAPVALTGASELASYDSATWAPAALLVPGSTVPRQHFQSQ